MFTSPTIPVYTITLLRHGESIGNAEGYIQGQQDFPLTECGRQQVQALADCWSGKGAVFDQVIASPLARARETAEIISESLKLPIEFDPDWMERNNGQLQGLSRAEAAEKFPRPAFIPPFQPIAETGESQWELYLRAGRAINTLLRRAPGRYLVVAHGGILNMALYAILGITPQANFQGPRFRFGNTSYAVAVYNPARHDWLLERLNEQISEQANGQVSK